MIEIKFRGKAIQNGNWIYGGIVHYSNHYGFTVDKWFIADNEGDNDEVQSNTVGQFTGLYDKNGKEIYEGDIVATKLNDKIITVGDIQFHCGVFGAEWRHAKKNKTMVGSWGQRHNLRRLDDDIIEKIEVIGNIYDNPELMEE